VNQAEIWATIQADQSEIQAAIQAFWIGTTAIKSRSKAVVNLFWIHYFVSAHQKKNAL
jgi:hypothetical protein